MIQVVTTTKIGFIHYHIQKYIFRPSELVVVVGRNNHMYNLFT